MSTTKRGLAVSTLSPNAPQQLRSPKAISTSLAAARRAAPISMLPNDAVAQAAIATAEASAASALRTLFAYEERVDAAESAARVALEQRDKAELLRKAAEDERERYKSACEQICEEFSLFRNATRETMEAQATKAVISQGRHMRAIGALKFECDGLLRRVVSLSDERDSQNETTIMNIASSSTSLLEKSSQFSKLDRVSLEGYCSSLVQQVAALHRTLVDAEARSAVNAASMANSEEATRRVAAYESFLVAIGEEAVVDQVSNQGDGATQVLSNRNKASSSSSSASVFVTENNTMTSTSTPTLVSSPFIPVSTSQISSTSPLIDVNFSPATSLHPTIEIERPSPSSFSSSIFVDNTAVTSNAVSNAPLASTGNFQKTLNRAASAMAILSSPTGTTRNGFGGEVKKRNKNVRVSHVISLDDPLSSSSKASAQQTHSLSSSSSSSWSLIPDNSVEIIVKSLNDALVATSQLASMTMPISSPEKKSTLSMRTSTSNLLTAASAVAMVREALSRSFELAQYFETHLVAANGRATAAEDRISHLATTLEALRDTVTAHESLASRRAAELQMTVRLLESAEKDRDSVRSLNSKLADTLRRAEVSLKTLAIAHSKLKKGLKKSILNTADPIISALIEKDESELESITSGAIRTTEELAVKSTDTDDIFLSQPVATQTIFLSSTPLPPSPPQQLQQQQQQNTNVQEPVNDVDNDSKIITNPPEPAFSLKSKDTTTEMSPRDHADACSALSVESLASVAVEVLLAASSAQVSISQPSFLTHSSPVSLTDTTLSKIVPTRVINLSMSPMDSTTLSTTPYLSSKTNQAQNLLYSPSFSQMQFRTTAPRPAPHSSTSGSSSVPPQLWSPGFAGTLFNVTNEKNLSTAPIVKTQSGDSNDDANDIALTAALSALLTAQQAQKSAQVTLTAAGVLFQQPSPLLNAPFSGLKTQFASPVPLSLSPQPLTPSAFPPVDLLTFSTKSLKSRSSTVLQNTHIHVQETIDEEEKPVSPTSSRGDPDEVVWNVHSSGSVMASSPPERITVSPPPAPILTSEIQPSLSSPTRRSSMATFAMTVQRGGGGTSVSNVSHYSTRYGRGNVNSESTAALKATIRARSQSSVTAFADASKSAVAVARVRGWSASAGALHAPPPATPLSKMKPTKSVPPETESKRLLNVLDKAESGSASEMFSSMISSDHMKKNIMSVTTTVPSSTTTSLLNGLLGVPTSNSFPPCSCVLSSINTSCSGCGSQLQGQKSQKSLLGFRSSTLSNGVGNHTLKSHKHCSHCLGPFCATCAGISHKLLAAPTRGGAGTLPRICNGCAGGLLLSGTVSNVDELKALRTALLS